MKEIFNYQGTDVTFRNEKGYLMVNATQMAKPFNKQPSDWTKTKSSQKFINSLSVVRKIFGTDLINVSQGGDTQGTWMHEDVALEFARWLSPEFAIWCNDCVKKLITEGKVELQQSTQPLSQLQILQQSVQMLVEQEKRLESVENEVKLIKAQTTTQTDYFTVAGYGTLKGLKVPLQIAVKVGNYASKKCRQLGIMMGECPDPRFGKVRTYPTDVLDEAFKIALN